MRTLEQSLKETLGETSFELVIPGTLQSGNRERFLRRVSASELRDVLSRPL